MSRFLCLSVIFLSLASSAAAQDRPADPQAYPDREFVASLYMWGAELDGTVETGSGSSADFDASFSDILENLNIGVFAAAGGRIGRFVGTFDGMWLEIDAEKDSGTVQRGPLTFGPAELDANMRQGMGDLKFGYRILEPATGARQPVSIDLMAGARYWYMHNEVDLELPGGDRNFKESMDWIDPLVGVRVTFGLTPRLQFVAMGDTGGWGAGSACQHTYQVVGLLDVKLSEAWSLRLGYRVLDLERDATDIEMRGPIVGTVYRF